MHIREKKVGSTLKDKADVNQENFGRADCTYTLEGVGLIDPTSYTTEQKFKEGYQTMKMNSGRSYFLRLIYNSTMCLFNEDLMLRHLLL